jgi:broad specificity phosphatase PhoE
MLAAHRLLEEIIASLRNVIAPAIPDPYPKAQAYMAAVILEFVARQVEERRDIAVEKDNILTGLFGDLRTVLSGKPLPQAEDADQEARLCRLIEWLYAEKDRLGPETFNAANQRVRAALRELLDQELKIAGTKE